MSITQEYEWIRRNIGELTYQKIEEFLARHPELYLSDVYYKKEVWDLFEREWKGGAK
jgi:hypothetical protein